MTKKHTTLLKSIHTRDPSNYARVTRAPALRVGVFRGFKNSHPDPYLSNPYPPTPGVGHTRDQHYPGNNLNPMS
jgi:hypothetical protein